MLSTMQDVDLTIGMLFDRGRRIYADSEVVTFDGTSTRRAAFETVASRADRLAAALHALGVRPGDRIGTLCTNTQEHLECYLAVPAMGAVLHTLNFRLHPDQLMYVINHAEDKVLIVEHILAPYVLPLLPRLTTVSDIIIIGGTAGGDTVDGAHDYEELLGDAASSSFSWPAIDEVSAAAMCYTTGTTGDPKGVVYSHRSTVLHALALCTSAGFGLSERDRVLPIVPMFHVNAWGLPYAGWLTGADFVMPGRFLQAEPLCQLIEMEHPTISCSIPSIWADILRHSDDHSVDLSSLRAVVCGGSAVPSSLVTDFEVRHGVQLVQAWGMTETSPAGAIAWPPKSSAPSEEVTWRARTGRVAPLVDVRIVDVDGGQLPWDGATVGELEVRGPWITGSYYNRASAESFHDGWLRTGDLATIDSRGFIQLTDRVKDVIKSGGEWISSVELETALAAHPLVAEAAVIGVPDEKWQERPLALVVTVGEVDTADLREFLSARVVHWWVPERWAFVDEIPKASVGKIDKKALRGMFTDGAFDVVQTSGTART